MKVLSNLFLTAAVAALLSFGVCRHASAQESAANAVSAKDKMVVETVLRLKDFDIESSPPAKAALLRYLRANSGTDQYFELVQRFRLTDLTDDLVALALEHVGQTEGVRAAETLAELECLAPLEEALRSDEEARAIAAATALGYVPHKQTVQALRPIVTDSQAPLAVRTAAVSALGRRTGGQRLLLRMAADGRLDDALRFTAANRLFGSSDEEIRQAADEYFQRPSTADNQPLPPLAELVKRRGDVLRGKAVFAGKATCSNCHRVAGQGKEVGPDLTEIGSKLSREAMYVAILDPSAAVSHNFETYTLLTLDGETVTGLMVSETDQAITLRTAEGIDRTVPAEDVELLKKQPQSLMPQDLQQLMTTEQLVDLVEYLMTLKKS
ncbi:c-type cytochrome [Roseimaritima sediminicola]|uniref:c-type cytochrome n=1 Tax=Roseimaritima sediminicola TaxID=2662066 RepID=UPI00129855FC|nr:c-type cytochrome [Roseimaritima sediminicola]